MKAPVALKRKVGIIDLGSNSARLMVAHFDPGQAYRITDEISRRVRLSEGMASGGRLRAPAILRAVQAVRMFKAFCDGHGIRRIVPVATAAVRDAANRSTFLAQLRATTGLKFRVLNGEREAYFGVLGVINGLGLRNGMVIDVGGGSAEISHVRRGRFRRGETTPLGAVRLTEMFLSAGETVEPDAVARTEAHIAEQFRQLPWMALDSDKDFVGIGGTVRALARMDREARAYAFALTNGYILERDRLAAMTARLGELPVSERVRAFPGLQTDRADIILAGALVVLGAMRAVGAHRLTVCGHGLREGLFFKEFLRPQDPPIIANLREFSVMNLARLYGYEADHSSHVAGLALSLFDQLADRHDLGDQEREWLWAASMLHDIGTVVDYYDHHKHSAYIILNAGLPGYTHHETAMIALLCRFHRKGQPAFDEFRALPEPEDAVRADQLSALLRLAEYLDRSRTRNVVRLQVVEAGRRKLRLRARARRGADARVEIWEAQRNADLFEAAFQCKLEIMQE